MPAGENTNNMDERDYKPEKKELHNWKIASKEEFRVWAHANLSEDLYPEFDFHLSNLFFYSELELKLNNATPPADAGLSPRLQLAGMLAAGLIEKNWQNTKKGTCEIATVAFHYADDLIAEDAKNKNQ